MMSEISVEYEIDTPVIVHEVNEPWDGVEDFYFEKHKSGLRKTNVPRIVSRHSDVYDWGYGGAGPADLALNILLNVTNDEPFSMTHYQSFKWDFVSQIPDSGGIIRMRDIRVWLNKKSFMDRDY